VIKNSEGKEVKKLSCNPVKGIQKLTWNLRMESTSPLNPNKPKPGRYESADDGHLVTAGNYTVEVYNTKNGVVSLLLEPMKFVVKDFDAREAKSIDNELLSFRNEVAEINRSVSGSQRLLNEYNEKYELMKFGVSSYPGISLNLLQDLRKAKLNIDTCYLLLYGDGIKSSKEVETPPTFVNRLGYVNGQLFETSSAVSKSQKENLTWVKEEYEAFRLVLNATILQIKALEEKLDQAKIPYLKGKDEKWKRD
jgi:hypothetical protein